MAIQTSRITSKRKQEILKQIAAYEDKIFSITFIKRSTGQTRHMVCRRYVSKGVKGTSRAPRWKDDWDNDCLTVFEMAGDESHFKRIPLEGIIAINNAPLPADAPT